MQLKNTNWHNVFLYVILVFLSIEVIILVRQNNQLKELLTKGTVEQIKEGAFFKNISVVDTSGIPSQLSFKDTPKKTILFIFSTKCKYCIENIVNWESIYKKYLNEYRIVALSDNDMNETNKYVRTNNISFPVYVAKNSNFRKEYKIAGVPQTIILNQKGLVEKFWLGLLNDLSLEEVEQSLSNSNTNNTKV